MAYRQIFSDKYLENNQDGERKEYPILCQMHAENQLF